MANACISACQYNYQRCFGHCNSSLTCTFECNAAFNDCENGCPCFQDCLNGCENCNSGFCKCQNRYSNPDYLECEEKYKKAKFIQISMNLFPLKRNASRLNMVSVLSAARQLILHAMDFVPENSKKTLKSVRVEHNVRLDVLVTTTGMDFKSK